MKIITLTQPWATLVAIGAKRVETRSWSTRYRGQLGIHAAKGMPMSARLLCHNQPFARVLKRAGYDGPEELPRGRVLCVANLQSVVPTSNVLGWISDDERAFGDYSAGRCAWVMGAPPPFALREPIACNGRLGLWKPPLDLAQQLAALGCDIDLDQLRMQDVTITGA